jgi:hypothetical protein
LTGRKHFAVSVLAMGSLSMITVWRNIMTTGPTKDRYYFFPNDTWIGRIDRDWLGDLLNTVDHSWLNDFLLGPGTVSCFYLAFTVLYAFAGLFSSPTPPRIAGHQRRMQIILYVILGGMLYSAWTEEVQLVPSPFIFDVKDVVIEGAGALLGFWMIRLLSYPNLSGRPQFADMIRTTNLAPKFLVDVAAVFAGAAYTWIVDPFGLAPSTVYPLWTLPLEFSLVFLVVRRALVRGLEPRSERLLLQL